MERFKRTFTFRKDKSIDLLNKTSKPLQWNDDEKKVREGTCSFQVKYLGSIEVFESRGMPVCEEAMRQLLKFKLKKKSKRAVLYVRGDALRVTEEISKGLIVDQVIEKVSFCAPDRNHQKGFAYICRDATTRRWLCHGFKAINESGERLSHAVGCAFAVCLERKKQREKETVEVTFNDNKTSFTRLGSFKQATITERLRDPQSVIIPEPIACNTTSTIKSMDDQSSIPRPRASQSVLDRQSSLRIFPKLQDEQKNPFKRDYSVRVTDLSSNLERKQQIWQKNTPIKEDVDDVITESFPKIDNNHSFSSYPSQINSKSYVDKQSTFNHLLGSDPFSAAPINPAAHIKEYNVQERMKNNLNNCNIFPDSNNQSTISKELNRNPQAYSKDVSNNYNHSDSFNHNGSTSWSDNILRPPSQINAHESRTNTNHNNPFDVSWINNITRSYPSTNPFKP